MVTLKFPYANWNAAGHPRRVHLALLRIGARFGGPDGIDGLLLIDPGSLGDLVPSRSQLVKDRLRIFASPQATDRLRHGLIVLVLLQQREIEQSCLAGGLHRVEISRRVLPTRTVFFAGVVRGAEGV